MTTLASAAADPGPRLVAFAARLRRRFAVRAARDLGLHVLLVLAGPAIVIAWLLPARLPWLGVGLAGAVALAAAIGWLRGRAVRDRVLWRELPADADTRRDVGGRGVFGDELATWLECHRSPAKRRAEVGGDAMVDWLGRDVAAQLPAAAPARLRSAGRRPLGRLRWLLPIVLVLLLAWLLSLWLAPPWAGAQHSSGANPTAGGGGGTGGADAGGAGAAPQPAAPEPAPSGERAPTAPPPPPPPAESPPAEPAEPAPLLELPEQQHFVVPEFFDDGPTRRVRMHAAAAAEGAAPPPAVAPQRGGEGRGEAPPVPPPSAETFAHAAEQAQQARHVPSEEQAMVRRFFDLLREAAK